MVDKKFSRNKILGMQAAKVWLIHFNYPCETLPFGGQRKGFLFTIHLL